MSTLGRYLTSQYFKFLGICHAVFISLYLIVHFFDRIDNFAEADAATSKMAAFFLLQIPFIAAQMLPPAAMIALIITFSIMERNNETVALKACGISLGALCRPVLGVSTLLAIVLFLLSEVIVPISSTAANRIWRLDVQKQGNLQVTGRHQIWFKGSSCIYHIPFLDSAKGLMMNPTFYFLDDSFNLVKKIDAKRAGWRQGVWELQDGISLEGTGGGEYVLKRFERMSLALPEAPESFIAERRKPEEMNLWELRAFAREVRDEGYDAGPYFVDLNIKLAFPAVLIIMSLLAPPIALWRRRLSTPVAVSAGAAACFIYLLVLGASRALGIAGLLPPLAAGWAPNAIFLLIGIWLIVLKDN
jgi:lipopolysaccharide export system permease protein